MSWERNPRRDKRRYIVAGWRERRENIEVFEGARAKVVLRVHPGKGAGALRGEERTRTLWKATFRTNDMNDVRRMLYVASRRTGMINAITRVPIKVDQPLEAIQILSTIEGRYKNWDLYDLLDNVPRNAVPFDNKRQIIHKFRPALNRGNPFAFTLFPYPENEGNTGGVSFLDSVRVAKRIVAFSRIVKEASETFLVFSPLLFAVHWHDFQARTRVEVLAKVVWIKPTTITLRGERSRRVRKDREVISGIYRSPLRESLPIPGTVRTSRRVPRAITIHRSKCSLFFLETFSLFLPSFLKVVVTLPENPSLDINANLTVTSLSKRILLFLFLSPFSPLSFLFLFRYDQPHEFHLLYNDSLRRVRVVLWQRRWEKEKKRDNRCS